MTLRHDLKIKLEVGISFGRECQVMCLILLDHAFLGCSEDCCTSFFQRSSRSSRWVAVRVEGR